MLLHDIRLLWFVVLKVFWAEVRIENVETITTKDRFKVNFATDLVIDSWNHFAALVVAHFEVESQMLTILLAFNIAYGIFEWVSENCNKEDPVEVVQVKDRILCLPIS